MMNVEGLTVPRLVHRTVKNNGSIGAQYSRNSSGDFDVTTYDEMWEQAMNFAGALLSIDVLRGEKIGLISEDRKEWQQADLGILSVGAVDVPRGNDTSRDDLKYILSVVECRICIAETNSVLKKIIDIKSDLPMLKTLILFDEPSAESLDIAAKNGVKVISFSEMIEAGKKYREKSPGNVETELEKGSWDDVGAIIFTSGTTGVPKGVVLTHGNFLSQLVEVTDRVWLKPGEKALCVLPVWHVFMREVEYVILSQAAALCYSKPIGSVLLGDLAKLNPVILPAVPRVFEGVLEGIDRKMRRTGGATLAIYKFFVNVAILHSRMERKLFRQNIRFGIEPTPLWWLLFVLPWILLAPLKFLGNALVFKKIRAMLGKNFRGGVAGGGAYPKYVDEFFWAIGVNVIEGYGLTETAPIVSVRHIDAPIFGSIGSPLYGIQARIVDMEGNELKKGQKGVLQIKGPTVMKGYYKNPELTAKAVSKDGWLDTGDLAIFGLGGELKILGRVKDTIVLRGGENIEPLPLETKLKESIYIDAAVVIGQDQRNLGALILPNEDELTQWAAANGIKAPSFDELVKNPEVYKFIDGIVRETISAKNGFRAFERVPRFALLSKPFEVGRELSAKQELMRYKIGDLYAAEMKTIFRE